MSVDKVSGNKRDHPYHIVDPSPWPILCTISTLVLVIGLLLLMHREIWQVFALGLLGILVILFFWWRDVVDESAKGYHNEIVQIGLRYGMLLFIFSEVMFFVAWFWAYFDAALIPGSSDGLFVRGEFTGGQWPPSSMEGQLFDPWEIPILNTMILLTSGFTVTWAHHALRENNKDMFLRMLGITILLGILFTFFQGFEYMTAKFSFGGNIYTSSFFMATGFHGLHVIIGTIFLLVCFFRGLADHFTNIHHFGFEAAAWYWHFVDVVWLFLFTCIYYWGGE